MTAARLLPLLFTATLSLAQDDDFGPPRVFQLADSCARCHDASENAYALSTPDGEDASPHGLWKATMMAQAFRDPYWRAKMAREIEVGAAPQEEIEGLCLRCHAPAAHHHDRMMGLPQRSFAALADDPAAQDGVNCTTCHRMTDEGLGTPATYDGLPPHDLEARLYGPYPDPFTGPMRNFTGYEVTYGPHMVQSSVCATCHTLTTHHAGHAFPEQTPYFEWRNSVFSYEDGYTEQSKSCQACHMEDQGTMRVAHNPMGGDFPFLDQRPEVRGHRMIGGNAFMLELMADHAEALEMPVAPEDLRDTARATRRQLSQHSAALVVEDLRREDGALRFDVVARNLTGHKLPTGYPGRRAWLEVVVEVDGERWFVSGEADAEGRIAEGDAAFDLPHLDRVTRADQVQVYEMNASDPGGAATTHLTRMALRAKDNRLLPRGWRTDGPHVDVTAPVGVGDDDDFVGGQDTVTYDLAGAPAGAVKVQVRFLYQAVPPHWVDDLRASEAPDAAWFVQAYDQGVDRGALLARASAKLE